MIVCMSTVQASSYTLFYNYHVFELLLSTMLLLIVNNIPIIIIILFYLKVLLKIINIMVPTNYNGRLFLQWPSDKCHARCTVQQMSDNKQITILYCYFQMCIFSST